EVGVERLLRGPKARLERRRSSDDQLPFAPAEMLLDREVGDPPEVVAMKVRDRDRVDRLTVDVLLDRRQGGAAAVEQKCHPGCAHVDRGIGPAAVAERVAAAEELDSYRHAISYRPTR